jgi:tRNA threonylcarbamoyladenosine biosynthesis protein TsaB
VSTHSHQHSLADGQYLFLDASGLTARVGIWQEGRWQAWRESEAGALDALYRGVNAVMAEAQTPWEKLDGFIYVEGPGSVLGLRLAAMAIRTWQVDGARRTSGPARPVSACGSLHLAAAIALASGATTPFAVVTDARQGQWNLLKVTGTEPASLNASVVLEIADGFLPQGTLFHIPARKAWIKAPAHAQPLPASLREHPAILRWPGLLRPVQTAVPYGRAPEYKKWAGVEK